MLEHYQGDFTLSFVSLKCLLCGWGNEAMHLAPINLQDANFIWQVIGLYEQYVARE